MKGIMMNKKLKLILLGVLSIALVTGCSSVKPETESISLYETQINQEEDEKHRIELAKLTRKTYMEKMYKNGLWQMDFSEEKARLNEEYKAYVTNRLVQFSSIKFIVRSNLGFYNDGLMKTRVKNLGISELLKTPNEFVHLLDFEVAYFPNEFTSEEEIDRFTNEVEKLKLEWGEYLNSTSPYSLLGYLHEKNPVEKIQMLEKSGNFKETLWNIYASGADLETSISIKKTLMERYNDEFERLPHVSIKGEGYNIFRSVSNPNITFETFMDGRSDDSDATKYLSALAQSYMTEIVDALIDDAGLEEYIIPFIIPCGGDYKDIDTNAYDTSDIATYEEKIKFLNDGFYGRYDVNLYYLSTDEDYDFEAIYEISKKIKKIVSADGVGRNKAQYRTPIFVYFYTVNEIEDIKISKMLFNEHLITENYFRTMQEIHSITGDLWYHRADTEGFAFMDIFGIKSEKYMNIHGQINEDKSLDEFVKWAYQ